MKNSQNCTKCLKGCGSSDNLKKHIRLCHPDTNTNSNEMFFCKSCGKTFNHKRNLSFHMRLHDDIIDLTNQSPKPVYMIIKNSRRCPLCEYSNPPKGNFLQHLTLQHDVPLISEDLKFASESCFYEWKNKVENVNHCKFVQRNSTKKSKTHEMTNFLCHRSGFFVYKGNVVMEESKNIDPYCPAGIRLEKKSDGTCQVSYLKTHVGHENDLDNIPNETLSTSEGIQPVFSSASVDHQNSNECGEAQRTVTEEQFGSKMEGDFVPKPEPEDVLQQLSDNMNALRSESLEDEKQELIDRITKHIRNIQSQSKLDILGKMTDKLIEVLNENNIL